MKHYQLKNNSKSFLESKGFRYCSQLSESEEETIYRKRFPVYKYYEFTLLDGEFTINVDSNDLIVDVIDNGRGRYGPFYHDEFGVHEPLLKIINDKIQRELNYIGAVEKDDSDDRKGLFEMPVPRTSKSRRSKKSKSEVSSKK